MNRVLQVRVHLTKSGHHIVTVHWAQHLDTMIPSQADTRASVATQASSEATTQRTNAPNALDVRQKTKEFFKHACPQATMCVDRARPTAISPRARRCAASATATRALRQTRRSMRAWRARWARLAAPTPTTRFPARRARAGSLPRHQPL